MPRLSLEDRSFSWPARIANLLDNTISTESISFLCYHMLHLYYHKVGGRWVAYGHILSKKNTMLSGRSRRLECYSTFIFMQALCCHVLHHTHSRDSSVVGSQHVIRDILLGEIDSSLDFLIGSITRGMFVKL